MKIINYISFEKEYEGARNTTGKMVEQKDMHSSSLWELQNYNSLLNNQWHENVGSHQKKILHIQGQRKNPNKTVRAVKSRLEPNPIPARDAWRAQTKSWPHQDPGTPQRLSQTCVWVSCRGMGQPWPTTGAGPLGADTRVTKPVHKPSWRRLPLTPPQSWRGDNRQTAELF